MALEAFCWHTPVPVLIGLPLLHTEITSVPLASTERMRDDTSLPLPLYRRTFAFLCLFLCNRLGTHFCPTNRRLRASSAHIILPKPIVWPRLDAQSTLPSSSCEKNISCQFFCRLQIPRACQCGHLIPRSRVSHITATSEILEPVSSKLLLFMMPFSSPGSFCPVLQGGELFFHFKNHMLPQTKTAEVVLFLPTAAAICLLNFFFVPRSPPVFALRSTVLPSDPFLASSS